MLNSASATNTCFADNIRASIGNFEVYIIDLSIMAMETGMESLQNLYALKRLCNWGWIVSGNR